MSSLQWQIAQLEQAITKVNRTINAILKAENVAKPYQLSPTSRKGFDAAHALLKRLGKHRNDIEQILAAAEDDILEAI